MPVGPDGGDARSLAYDPRNPEHIFLGTSTGTIFHSLNHGKNWKRLAHVGTKDNSVIDHIVIDPRNSDHIYVAAWDWRSHHAGDLLHSVDGGSTWKATPAMHGESIRAIAIAAADPKILVVGALDGVFSSKDAGQTWQKISARTPQIKNVESIAIDPQNSEIIYVGTWHLGWKTSDGGSHWRQMKEGIIDDSDIFSIVVDQANSSTIFASACSGIYASHDGGRLFDRSLSLPFSARRTRVLKQDPSDGSVILAGTTEGLWITNNLGQTWTRVSDSDLVVNDILVDPNSSRVLLATDRAGVLASDDRQHFASSNIGFANRYISTMLTDRLNSNVLYVGVVNDREFGGVFVSDDAGQHWAQVNEGLDGRDVFVVKQSDDGTVLAGTSHGVFALFEGGLGWIPLNKSKPKSESTSATDDFGGDLMQLKVNDLEFTSTTWFAATSAGLYQSSDNGRTWYRKVAMGKPYLAAVRARGNVIVAASTNKVLVSADSGQTWKVSHPQPAANGIRTMTLTPAKDIVIACDRGVYHSSDLGTRWSSMRSGLPKQVVFLTYDSDQNRLLAVSNESTAIFETNDGRTWHQNSDTGYRLRQLGFINRQIIAATVFDGIIMQTQSISDR